MLFLKLCMTFAFLGLLACAREVEGKEGTTSSDLSQSESVALEWLKNIDAGDYKKSWNQGSSVFQSAISEAEWVKYLDEMRKPFGKESSRKLMDQRTAKDPKGLPQGDYMVLVYETSFSGGKKGVELLTLISTDQGWKILTYQIASK